MADLSSDEEGIPPADKNLHLSAEEEICRVCRVTAAEGRPLFHPCMCAGTIRYVHQDCLLQWLKHSGKRRCELCHHEFNFLPIYRPDMPRQLPAAELLLGLANSCLRFVRQWTHLSMVAFMWLIIVPLCIARVYYFLVFGSIWSIYLLPFNILSFSNWFYDVMNGLLIVGVTLVAFICVVWLKDQVTRVGNPNWLARDQEELENNRQNAFENRLDELDQELDEIGEDANQRRNHPQRQEFDQRTAQLRERIEQELTSFQHVSQCLHTRDINHLWLREMELLHRLSTNSTRLDLAVRSARERVQRYEQEEGRGDVGAAPEVSLTRLWYSGEGDLDQVDLRLLGVVSRPPPPGLSCAEEQALQRELKEVRRSMDAATEAHTQYLDRAMGAIEVHVNETDEELPIADFHPDEQELILKIRDLKRQMHAVQREEQDFIDHQQRRADWGRRFRHFRQRRWFRRWLNNEDEFGMPRRPRRANLGAAIAGLARDNGEEAARNNNVDLDVEPQEEITWSKLLGLDGSFRFLEHVLWVICMNSLVIFVFVYLPYQLGYVISQLTLTWHLFGTTPYSGAVATFIGYLAYVGLTVFGYWLAQLAKIPRMKTMIGFSYVTLKVGLILVVEAGIFPLLCGWWMDVCSFSVFGTVFKDRQASLRKIPGTITFIHWLVGMVYIFYFASFVMLLREILRPGVLWFLRNLNDQNFHPIQEMILLPLSRQIRRFLMSSVMFGTSVLVVIWLPVRMVKKTFPDFLPYHLTLSSSVDPLREIQFELILLHIVLPTVLEQSNTKAALLYLVKILSQIGGKVFDLNSYLLDLPQAGGRVVDMHGKLLYELPDGTPRPGPVFEGNPQVLGPGFAPFKPYLRPRFFLFKILGFISFTVICMVLFSSVLLTIPVLVGRLLLTLAGISPVPDLYASAIGFYSVWILCRLLLYLWDHLKQDLQGFLPLAKLVVVRGSKCVVAGVLLLGVIPLLLGLLCDAILFVPIRVPLDRTPVYFISTDWALGLLHTKCVCGLIWLGNSNLKRNLDQIYRNGVRNMDLQFTASQVALPVIAYLSLALAVPYIAACGVVPHFETLGLPSSVVNYVQRRIYPFIALSVLGTVVLFTILLQLRTVYKKIRDERYLIGQRLMNYPQQRGTAVAPVQ